MTQVSFKEGDIFQSGCDVLVNPVNACGVMGAGLALAFKQHYAGTGMEAFYQRSCEMGALKPGCKPVLWRAPHELAWEGSPSMMMPSVLLFVTKDRWAQPSKLEWIRASLLAMQTMSCPSLSIAFCKLGSGLGGLDWDTQVKPVMEELLPHLSFSHIEVYE